MTERKQSARESRRIECRETSGESKYLVVTLVQECFLEVERTKNFSMSVIRYSLYNFIELRFKI